jgi:hypothetical protein
MSGLQNVQFEELAEKLGILEADVSLEASLKDRAASIWSGLGTSVDLVERVVAQLQCVAEYHSVASVLRDPNDPTLLPCPTSALLLIPPVSPIFVWAWHTVQSRVGSSNAAGVLANVNPVIVDSDFSNVWACCLESMEFVHLDLSPTTEGPEVRRTVLFRLDNYATLRFNLPRLVLFWMPRWWRPTIYDGSVESLPTLTDHREDLFARSGKSLQSAIDAATMLGISSEGCVDTLSELTRLRRQWRDLAPSTCVIIGFLYEVNTIVRFWLGRSAMMLAAIEDFVSQYEHAAATCTMGMAVLYVLPAEEQDAGSTRVRIHRLMVVRVAQAIPVYLDMQDFDRRYCRIPGDQLWPLFTFDYGGISVDVRSGVIYVQHEDFHPDDAEGEWAPPRPTTSTIATLWQQLQYGNHSLPELVKLASGSSGH